MVNTLRQQCVKIVPKTVFTLLYLSFSSQQRFTRRTSSAITAVIIQAGSYPFTCNYYFPWEFHAINFILLAGKIRSIVSKFSTLKWKKVPKNTSFSGGKGTAKIFLSTFSSIAFW